MKTIKSVTLLLAAARERVYELDIVELEREDNARFLVNYRYGWVGKELQEGTRTPDPVAMDIAEQIFASLVLSRETQGYREQGADTAWGAERASARGPQAVAETVDHPRNARIMYLLSQLIALPDEAAAKLIWRAGQVRLATAAPLLAGFVPDAQAGAMRAG